MVIILKALHQSIDEVQENLDRYWLMYGDAAAVVIAGDLHDGGPRVDIPGEVFRLNRLLDTVSRKPLQDICPVDLTDEHVSMSYVYQRM